MPGERIARQDERGGPSGYGASGGSRPGGAAGSRAGSSGSSRPGGGPGDLGGPAGSRFGGVEAPFVVGEIADRGPVERAAAAEAAIDGRAREAREWERQADWRDQAARALEAFKAEAGTGPANGTSLEGPADRTDLADRAHAADSASPADRAHAADLVADDERLADRAIAAAVDDDGPALRVDSGILPTLRVYPYGVSRKRLEQAVRELQLPVIVARLVDEADVVMTLRSEYRQKGPTIREAEDLALPVYVLKANTIVQMQASLTSIFALEVDPREAALRETEEAIGLVSREAQPVELAPQNAYVRRLQHQMAERANVVSRSRGREPYRRVRLYPDEARTWR
jgi:hypothetical protein